MKKVYFVLAITLFAFVFASCTKEGAYKPKERISKIFSSYSWTYSNSLGDHDSGQSTKNLDQMWKWDGKMLTQIDYYNSNGSISSSYNFTYDKKKRIERIDDYKNSYYTIFKYDGNVLKTVETWSSGTIVSSANITSEGNAFSGSKIKKIELAQYSYKKNADGKNCMSPLSFLLGDKMANEVEKVMEKSASRGGVNLITIDLTWNKNNVSSMKVSGNDGGYWESSYTFTYDSNKNPFYKMYAMVGNAYDGEVTCFSENNVTGYNYTYIYDGETSNGTTSYNISYDGKFPSMNMYTRQYTDEDERWVVDEEGHYNEYYEWIPESGHYETVSETETYTYTDYYEYE